MVGSWLGQATLRPGRFLYAGAVGTADLHAHHAVQLLVSAADELVLRDGSGQHVTCRAVVIPAHVPHAIVSGTSEGAMALLDPGGSAGRDLLRRAGHPSADAPSWAWDGEPLDGAEPDGVRHPAIVEAVALLPGLLHGKVRLAEVAQAVHLSESRLAHLFREELGLPFRSYVLWLRMQRSIEHVAAGHSLTDAAHAAGFADGAHLTRVCRRTFGSAPSELARAIRWVG